MRFLRSRLVQIFLVSYPHFAMYRLCCQEKGLNSRLRRPPSKSAEVSARVTLPVPSVKFAFLHLTVCNLGHLLDGIFGISALCS